MNTTTNINLKKPELNESFDIQTFNDNADLIDAQFAAIPSVPTKTSELTNDSSFITETELNAAIEAAIGQVLGGSY